MKHENQAMSGIVWTAVAVILAYVAHIADARSLEMMQWRYYDHCSSLAFVSAVLTFLAYLAFMYGGYLIAAALFQSSKKVRTERR